MLFFINNSDNREFLTFIKCINVNRFLLLSILIVTLQTLFEVIFIDELPVNYLITCSETGYSNIEINNEWIRYFDKFIKILFTNAYRILISNGFNTYIEFEFV